MTAGQTDIPIGGVRGERAQTRHELARFYSFVFGKQLTSYSNALLGFFLFFDIVNIFSHEVQP